MASIRKARKGDLKDLSKILKAVFNDKSYKDGWTDKSALKHMEHEFKIGNIFVLIHEKKIIGTATVRTHIGPKFKIAEIMDFAIVKKYSGKGFGSQLLKELEKILKKDGYKQIYFEVYHKSKAIDFYKKHKYKQSSFSSLMIKRFG